MFIRTSCPPTSGLAFGFPNSLSMNLSRCVCPQQQTPCAGNTRRAGKGNKSKATDVAQGQTLAERLVSYALTSGLWEKGVILPDTRNKVITTD